MKKLCAVFLRSFRGQHSEKIKGNAWGDWDPWEGQQPCRPNPNGVGNRTTALRRRLIGADWSILATVDWSILATVDFLKAFNAIWHIALLQAFHVFVQQTQPILSDRLVYVFFYHDKSHQLQVCQGVSKNPVQFSFLQLSCLILFFLLSDVLIMLTNVTITWSSPTSVPRDCGGYTYYPK